MLRRILAVLALALPTTLAGQLAPRTATGSGGITLVREQAIGTDTAGPDYEIVDIGHAAPTRSGSVFVSVYDGSAVQIRKYDSTGRFRGNVGRSGSGPGEYRVDYGMAVVGDSLLVVYDPLNGRVVLFDTAGVPCGTFRAPAIGSSRPGLAVFSDGSIAVRTRVVERSPSGGDAAAPAFVHYRLNGDVIDTIRVAAEETADVALGVRNLGWRFAFPATTVFTLLPRGGIATAHTTAYRVDVAPASGPRFVIERSVPPVPLTGREREEWQAMIERGGGGGPRRVPTLPRLKPFIRALSADAEGRIWVEVYTEATRREPLAVAAPFRAPPLTMWEHNGYDVFDERGRYLGRVDLPPFSVLLAVLGDRAWVSEATEEGAVVLVRYRMNVPQVR